MLYTSAWPYFACMTMLICIFSCPAWRFLDASRPIDKKRASSIDGLRGILALGVFFHHAAIYHTYIETGEFHLTASPLYNMLGQGGVALFFMITAYLFWGKMIATGGRPPWIDLYIGRVFG